MNSPFTVQIDGCSSNKSLPDWLSYLETLHPQEIELGLERVRDVFQRQNLSRLAFKIIVVAGTNGKGSTIAMLESILLQAGYSVGSYTSPHLHSYNERVRIGGIDVDDKSLCRSFAQVERARKNTSLSYFEFGTLAAFDIFSRHQLDVVLLEVGLGGRLDAVNIIDADISVITSIDIDHEEWLGNDREKIGFEKAGIMRKGCVTVCGERDMPESIRQMAKQTGAILSVLGEDFDVQRHGQHWDWIEQGHPALTGLSKPALGADCQLDNAAVAIAVLQQLVDFPVDSLDIIEGLENVHCRGRFERRGDGIESIFDVAHNPASAAALAQTLASEPVSGQTRVVFGVMADKDIQQMITQLSGQTTQWYLAAPVQPRAAEPEIIRDVCISGGISSENVACFDSVIAAFQQAQADSTDNDRVVVCGSFYTVAEAMAQQL